MKKPMTILLVAALLLSLMAGCGQTAPEASASAQLETSAVSATEPAPEPETPAPAPEPEAPASAEESVVEEEPAPELFDYELPITDGSVTYTFFEAVNPNVASFIEGFQDNHVMQQWQARTGVALDIVSVHPSYAAENFNILLAAGDLPDLTSSGLKYYNGSTSAAVEEEIFADLCAYEDACPNYMTVLAQHDDALKSLTTDEGYMPAFYQIQDNSLTKEGLVIRQDWLDQVDMDVPATYDELHDVLTAFKSELNVPWPMMMRSSGAWNNGVFSWGYDINAYMTTNPLVSLPLFVQDGKVKFSMMEDAYGEYITMLSQWFSEGLIYNDLESITMYMGYMNQVVNDEIGFFYTSADVISNYEEAAISDSFALTAMESPKRNVGDEVHFSAVLKYSSTGGWAVSATAEDIETLIQCVDYLYSPEGFILANYGVEGETYELDAEGNPHFTDLITRNPDGMSMDSAVYIYTLQNGAFNEDYTRYTSTFSDRTQEMVDVWNHEVADSYMYPASNVSLNSEESERAAQILSDITATVDENILKFIKGDRSVDEFDTFRQELRDLGIEEFVSIYQDAYDRYLTR